MKQASRHFAVPIGVSEEVFSSFEKRNLTGLNSEELAALLIRIARLHKKTG